MHIPPGLLSFQNQINRAKAIADVEVYAPILELEYALSLTKELAETLEKFGDKSYPSVTLALDKYWSWKWD